MFLQNLKAVFPCCFSKMCLVIFFLILFELGYGQELPASRQSDEQLLSKGKNSYDQNEFAVAAVYLYAYLQRRPSQLNDVSFRTQLYSALDFSLQKAITKQGLATAGLDDKSDNLNKNVTVYHQKPFLPSAGPNSASTKIQSAGHWNGNDGGTYYIRQVGSEVWWYGQSPGANSSKGFANVMHGHIDPTTNNIIGVWSSVPSGSNSGSGDITLQIVSSKHLKILSQTGGFVGSEWNAEPLSLNSDLRNKAATSNTIRNKR